MNKVVYHYPKDEQGNKTGHTLCIIVDGDDVFVGEALCSKSDSFSKAQGRNIAYVRALKRKQRATEARAQHQGPDDTEESEYSLLKFIKSCF